MSICILCYRQCVLLLSGDGKMVKKWSRQSKLTAEDGEMDDSFGRSVGIYGAEALVGAYFDDDKDMDSGTHPTI